MNNLVNNHQSMVYLNKLYEWIRRLIVKIYIYLCVVGILLAGCTNIETIQEEIEDEAIVIEFWYGLKGYPNQLMKEMIEDYNHSQSTYEVIGVEQTSHEETFAALKAAIARQKAPSVVLLENQELSFLVSKGVIDSIDTQSFELDDFIYSYLSQNTIQDNVYGMPMFGGTQVLYYRKDFLENNNIKPVDLLTWESLASVSEKLSEKQGDETIVYGWEFMYGVENLIDASISNGGEFLNADGKKIKINSKEWVDAWNYFRRLIHEEKVMYIHYGGEEWNHWYATIDDVKQGRAAGYIGSCGDMGDLDMSIIGTYLLPNWNDKLYEPKGVVNLQSFCLPMNDATVQEGAIDFIKYMTSVDSGVLWATKTGYLPVRKSVMDQDAFYEAVLANPDYFIPIRQVKMGAKTFIDPTEGHINEQLELAAYKVLIENVDAQIALDEAAKNAQAKMDELFNQWR